MSRRGLRRKDVELCLLSSADCTTQTQTTLKCLSYASSVIGVAVVFLPEQGLTSLFFHVWADGSIQYAITILLFISALKLHLLLLVALFFI